MAVNDRVALITGAGSGLGKAAALRLAEEGYKVAALSHTPDEIQQTANTIELAGGQAIPITADIGDFQAMVEAVQQIESEWGRLDVVFANAGVNGVWAPIEDLKPEEWESTIKANLTGTFFTIKAATPLLKRQGGSIIVTASVNGSRMFSNTGASAYSTSKAGQVALAKMLAVELGEWKVRVNVICPGRIESEISENTEQRNTENIGVKAEYPEGPIPLTGDRPGAAEQVADLVLFLAGDASSHITGTEIFIDGGQSLVQG
jgi:NAD(P)-dependent dehydrogenase (short-subunit alcohol dehydrogenase family)